MFLQIVIAAVLITANEILADLTELMGTLAKEIVLKYFMDIQPNNLCLGLVTEESSELLDYLLPLDIATVQVNLSRQELLYSRRLANEFEEYAWEEKIMATINMPCLAYVIQTSNIKWMVKSFGRMFSSEKSSQRYNRTFLYLPVVTDLTSNEQFEEHIRQVFAMKEMDFMPDLGIVKVVKEMYIEFEETNRLISGNSNFSFEDMDIEIITHRYVSSNPSERVVLDVWNSKRGFLYGADLFPYKMSDMMGKAITLVTINYEPVTVIDWDKDPSTYDGLEPQFIFEWARRSNFTYNWAHDDEFWGKIYKNGSGVGIFGILSSDRADIAFNAFFLWESEYHYLDYSTSHSKTSIILVCPKPNLLPGWMVPILPFNYDMWLAVLISVAACTTILYIASLASVKLLVTDSETKFTNMYSSWTECGFRTLGLLVLQVPPDERDWSTPRFVPMRHLVTWLILFYFVVTTAYSGGLATVLTVPRYEKPTETAQDMVEHKLKWTGLYDAYVNSIRNTTNPIMMQVEKSFELDAEGDDVIPWLIAKTKTRKYCVALEKMLGGAFFLPSFINEDSMKYLRIMREELYFSLTVFATRKGSPLMQVMNKILGKARDAGLFYYWEALTVRNYLSTRRQLAVTQSRIEIDEGPTKLLLQHIQGAFYLLGVGLAVGIIIYISEILTHRITLMKKQVGNKNGNLDNKKERCSHKRF